jgi:hypothetical protein
MREDKKQIHTCPFEHISSRAKVKGILSELRQLNPEVNDSFYAALTNIKKEYLPLANNQHYTILVLYILFYCF